MIDLNKIAAEQPMIMEIVWQHLDEIKRIQFKQDGLDLPDNHILIGEPTLSSMLASAVYSGIELQKGWDKNNLEQRQSDK